MMPIRYLRAFGLNALTRARYVLNTELIRFPAKALEGSTLLFVDKAVQQILRAFKTFKAGGVETLAF